MVGGLLKLLGRLATEIVPINQMFLVAVTADPVYIGVGYEETVTVEIGMMDLDTGEFKLWDKPKGEAVFNERYLNFEVIEYPGGNEDRSWHVEFSPEIVFVVEGIQLKTNVSISLTSPPISKNAIQSGILKIRILDTWAYGNLWFPPNNSPMDEFIKRFMWFISAAFTMRFGKYSGSVDTEFKDVEILVKVKPYHAAKIEALSIVEMRPNEITSIPISIQNLGNYNDTYSFRVVSEHDNIEIVDPVSITLAPGKTKDTYIGVAALPSVFDYGTLHKINIEAYSIDDVNTTIASRAVLVETKGLFVSETMGILFVSFIAIVIFGFAYTARRQKNISKKPSKEPKKVKKSTKKSKKEKTEESKSVLSNFFIKFKEDKKEKIKPKKIKPKKEEKSIEAEVRVDEETKPIIDKKLEAEKRRKDSSLAKIKRQQEKQKRKLGGRVK